MTSLTLASASPRRHSLLQALDLTFDIFTSDAEERTNPVPSAILTALPAYPLAQVTHPTLLAWRKASAAQEAGRTGVILGADTIVVLDNQILGKPRDADHACLMLSQLAGRTHTVYTGITVLVPQSAPLFDLVAAQVQLSALDPQTIKQYVATGEPLDKAGAYGIQGLGGRLVEQVEGSFTAVVGLPLGATAALLQQAGMSLPRSVEQAWNAWCQSLEKEPLCIHNKSMF